MNEKTVLVRLHHPLYESVMELSLPRSATFAEILRLLYDRHFIEKKLADYGFLIDRRLCAMNKSLGSYVLPETDAVDVEVNGFLTIMT